MTLDHCTLISEILASLLLASHYHYTLCMPTRDYEYSCLRRRRYNQGDPCGRVAPLDRSICRSMHNESRNSPRCDSFRTRLKAATTTLQLRGALHFLLLEDSWICHLSVTWRSLFYNAMNGKGDHPSFPRPDSRLFAEMMDDLAYRS